ncbi:MAG: MBL fold metallo-hydrolase [Bacteroidota bacterium]
MKYLFRKLIICWLAIGNFACHTSQPKRMLGELPVPTLEDKNWDKILGQKAVIDSFKILHTGSVQVPLDGVLNPEKVEIKKDSLIWVDVFAYLFHHRERGWFLIDSGLDSSFQKKGNIKGWFASNYIKASRQAKGQNIGAQLSREQKEIQAIYFTHLHGDHSAGLPEIDDRIPKYVAKGEAFIHIPWLYTSNHLNPKDTLRELDWEQGFSKAPLKSVIDIFGDTSFLGIHTPGHSRSHLSYLLMTEEGPILLTGDASHTRYGFEHNIEPGWVDDREKAEDSIQQLIAFKKQYPQLRVIYGHQL